MSPGESYDIHPQYNTARTTTVNISQISALPGNTADCPPPQHCHNNYSLHFSYFQLYQVTPPIDPPPHYNTARTTTVYISQISALPGNTAD